MIGLHPPLQSLNLTYKKSEDQVLTYSLFNVPAQVEVLRWSISDPILRSSSDSTSFPNCWRYKK